MTTNIPTPHIEATSAKQIASTVLMPGDPLRAKFIAETYLEDAELFNQVRGMLGYTGYYKGKRVSVMGSGMGLSSAGIYYTELFNFYDVDSIIRIGTAGSMQENIGLRDVVIATAAATDSAINTGKFGKTTFPPTPDFGLLMDAKAQADKMGITAHFGPVKSGDVFYTDAEEDKYAEKLADYGVLCAEMESAALFTIARQFKKRALGIYTISDSLVTSEAESSADREAGYTQMMELALEIAPE